MPPTEPSLRERDIDLPMPRIVSWREAAAVAEIERLREQNSALRRQVNQVQEERDALSHQLEADRTTVADAVTRLRRELDSRHWLTEGRGSYEWNDDRYREEFLAAGQALLVALKPLERLAADWSGCPKTSAEVAQARIDKDSCIAALKQERDEARAKAADGLSLIHENRLALNSTDLDDALRQVIQIAITEADNAKIAGRLLNCGSTKGMDVDRESTIRARIAELRRKEGE